MYDDLDLAQEEAARKRHVRNNFPLAGAVLFAAGLALGYLFYPGYVKLDPETLLKSEPFMTSEQAPKQAPCVGYFC